MTPGKHIYPLYLSLRRRILLFGAVKALLYGLASYLLCTLFSALLSFAVTFKYPEWSAARAASSAVAAAVVLISIVRTVKNSSLEAAAVLIRTSFPSVRDAFRVACELEREIEDKKLSGRSGAFAKMFSEQVAGMEELRDPSAILGFRSVAASAAALAVSVALSLIFFLTPAGLRVTKALFPGMMKPVILSVLPGDSAVLAGTPVRFEILYKTAVKGAVVLRLGNDGEHFVMNSEDKMRFEATAGPFSSDLSYSFDSGDFETKKYRLWVDVPAFPRRFTSEYIYPAYTGFAPEKRDSSVGDLACVYGTRVNVRVEFNRPLREAWHLRDSERRQCRIEGSAVLFTVEARASHRYQLSFTDTSGRTLTSIPYSVTVAKDSVPEVQILSPVGSIIAGRNDPVRTVYYASDDFALGPLSIEIELAGVTKTVRLDSPDRTGKSLYGEKSFVLSELFEKPVGRAFFIVTAFDNDTVSGPKQGRSQKIEIEIADYAAAHAGLLDRIAKTRERLFDQLAAEMELESSVRAALDRSSMTTALDLNIPAHEQKTALSSGTAALSRSIETALEEAKSDPMSDLKTLSELEAFDQNLKSFLTQFDSPVASKYAAAARKPDRSKLEAARSAHSAMIGEMEKLSLQLKNINEYQKMRDILDSARDAVDEQKKLKDKLEKLKSSGDPEKARAVEEAIRRIMELVDEISKKMSDRNTLPGEFSNSDSVKNNDFSRMGDAFSEMLEALEKGDLDSALSRAGEMLDRMQKVYDDLADAASEVPSMMTNALEDDLQKLGAGVAEAAARQRSILDRTGKDHESAFRISAAGNEGLALAAARHAEAIAAEMLAAKGRPPDNAALQKMHSVRNELAQRSFFYSALYLEEIIRAVSARPQVPGAAVARGTGTVELAELDRSIVRLETEVLDFFRTDEPAEANFPPGLSDELRSLSGEQRKARELTDSLKKRVDTLKMRSSLFGPAMTSALEKAGEKMESAAGNIDGARLQSAQADQRSALRHLNELLDNISSAGKSLEQGLGTPGAPAVPGVRMGGTGAASGLRSEPVRLPDLREFRATDEERLEILEGMSQNYPARYRDAVKGYYEKIFE